MPTALPSISNVLSNRLSQFGKRSPFGADLFSPQQSASPFQGVSATMARDLFDTSMRPLDALTGSSTRGDWAARMGLSGSSFAQGTGSSFRQGMSAFQQGQRPSGGTGNIGSFSGGDTAILNQYDQAFQAAGARYGIDPNWLKAVAAVERGWEGTSIAGAIGLMQIMPNGYLGLQAQFPNWKTDPYQNIMLGAAILADKIRVNGGTIEGGIQGYLGWGTDAYGTTNTAYLQRARDYYNQLQANNGSFGTVAPINGQWGGNPVGNSFVQAALQYQGVSYVWGAIPGANQNPWQTGWDCSGFTYFMNQKYGDGSLPMGSHYQYDYARRTGQLFTDMSRLQPGDLVFIDTGWQGGAGAELNRAGHVGIYIGSGQMIHAANPSTGTVVSPLSSYGGILGAMHQSGSGGGGGLPYAGGASSWMTGGTSVRQSILDQYRRFWS